MNWWFGMRWQLLRFPIVVCLVVTMLLVMQSSIDRLAEGVNLPLYYSARLEETSKMSMEAARVFDVAEQVVAGKEKPERLSLMLDVFWARVEVGATKNYQAVLGEENIDQTLVPELAAALPEFDEAVKAVRQGQPDSLEPLSRLKARFINRLQELSELAWTRRQQRMSQLVEMNLGNLSHLRSIQITFALIALISLSYVILELLNARRMNRTLNELIAEKRELLRTDALTGITNRVHFEDELQRLDGLGNVPFSVVYIDLDGFKQVNDTLGHGAGDLLLKDVAGILKSLAGSEDTPSRFGGDEFAVLIVGSPMRAESYVEAARLRVLALQPGGQMKIRVSASAGICYSTFRREGDKPEALMRYADLALYSAKESGRNRLAYFHPGMLEKHDSEQLMESLLPDYVAEGRLGVQFQPIARVADEDIFCVEALVRWYDPQLGQVPADRVIEIAERTGQIWPLTFWVLDRAIALRKTLESRGLDIVVSVNISPTLLTHPRFSDEVIGHLTLHNVTPKSILLELTEYGKIDDGETATNNLRNLQFAGIPIAIDDFGKAYANIQRLMSLNFHYLKLDRELINSVVTSPRALQILININNLAKSVGAEVVCEGIETEEQLQIIRTSGIQNGQGYLFARPMSAAALIDLVSVDGVQGSNVVKVTTPRTRTTDRGAGV